MLSILIFNRRLPMSQAVIEKTQKFAESLFADDGSGHDWWHVHRV